MPSSALGSESKIPIRAHTALCDETSAWLPSFKSRSDTLFHPLQPPWASFTSSNVPSAFSPQGLCTSSSCCPESECSSPTVVDKCLLIFYQLCCHLLRGHPWLYLHPPKADSSTYIPLPFFLSLRPLFISFIAFHDACMYACLCVSLSLGHESPDCRNHVWLGPSPCLPHHHSISPCVFFVIFIIFYSFVFSLPLPRLSSPLESKFLCSPFYSQHPKLYLVSRWWNLPKDLGSLNGGDLHPGSPCSEPSLFSIPQYHLWDDPPLPGRNSTQMSCSLPLCVGNRADIHTSISGIPHPSWLHWLKRYMLLSQKRKTLHHISDPSCSRLHRN